MTSLRKWWNKWRHRANRTVPSNRLILTLLVLAGLNFILSDWVLQALWFWGGLAGALVLGALYDLVGILRLQLTADRSVSNRPQLHIPFAVIGSVTYSPRFLTVETVDLGLTGSLTTQGNVVWSESDTKVSVTQATTPGGSVARWFSQTVLPVRRGKQKVSAMEFRVRSRWGLWHRLVRVGSCAEVLVVPDLTTWRQSVVALQKTLSQEGTHIKRLHHGDREFSHLADYVPDDDPRRINWAASARRRRLMKNVYEAERGQQLLIAVDASRYMQVTYPEGKTRLDYALECAAALASTALHTGDYVGVMGFTHQMLFQLPPRRGPEHWRRIVEQLAGLEAQTVQGGYETLLRHLRGSFHRRSLLIIVSELEGVVSDSGFLRVLGKAQRQHPTLFVTLADTKARQRIRATPARTEDAASLAAANWVLEERSSASQALRRQGVSIVESLPGDVVVDTVSAYLQRRLRLTR